MNKKSRPIVMPSEKMLERPMSEATKWHMNHKAYTVPDYLSKIGVIKDGGCNEDKKRTGNI